MKVLELFHKLGDLLVAQPEAKDWDVAVETCCEVKGLQSVFAIDLYGDMDLWLSSGHDPGPEGVVL